ncbi:MAG: cobalamin biosynthesis protein CobW [Alphaproteobacteria bacterium]|nr:cobalamin biosynthesis protein CobW [Alphaproteobacteria bacterium]
MNRIPATIVTGFLGAGKTTLLRKLAANAKGKRIAFVINEFGELGMDRELLLGCAEEGCAPGDVIELANGCICCTVADDFLPAIEKLLDLPEPPDHIVIETSGLALPKPLVQAFNWPGIKTRTTVDGVVTLIDGPAMAAGQFAEDEAALEAQRRGDPNLDHDNPIEEVFTDQLACADLVVLTKTDALDMVDRARLEAELTAKLRAGAKLVGAAHGEIPPEVLIGLDAQAEDDLATRPSHADEEGEHDHDDFDSRALKLGEIADPAAFAAKLEAAIAKHDVLRAKGFLSVPGKPMRLAVQAVGPRIERYFDRAWAADEPRASRLVVIGRKGLDFDAIQAALA